LEDTVLYVMFSIPITLITIWFGVDTFTILQAHNVVFDAAQAAAVSAATQTQYSVTTAVNGAGFNSDVHTSAATAIADQVFTDEVQKAGIENVIGIQNAAVTYPTSATAQYTVTVSYLPRGTYAAISAMSNLFGGGSLASTPILWTESPTANIQH
jgi:Flp pilus assembly protein TadG